MKCDKCNNEASIEIFISDGETSRKLNLCFDCYSEILNTNAKKNMNSEKFTFFKDVLNDLLSTMIEKELADNSDDKICDSCGMSLKDIAKKGKIGCEKCYDVFKDDIKNILLRTQGTFENMGSHPKRLDEKIQLKYKIDVLKNALDEIIKLEQYETAEMIKNQIESLEKKLEEKIGEIND